ncbi:hypothetical protein K7X08_030597 [Anisodus acutangulus]|uniref:Uncharacterized protein n=1 Tax=Anisodus acutangulus TaxID=402998 RepID=A0A9Q1RLM4_9SOLA|nr:hypothetical protein K7X08_030597 [Anisodus acutangulus]
MSVKSCVTKSGYGNGFLVEESDDDERVHSVTATKTGGNKRSRELEDVNWDKRRRLKMLFYVAAESLYLSQTKDPNNGKKELDTQFDEVTEVNKNPRGPDCPELDVPYLQDSKVAGYPELNIPDLQNSWILDVEPKRSKEGTKTCSSPSSLYG